MDKTINELTELITPSSNDVLAIYDINSSSTKKITVGNLGGSGTPGGSNTQVQFNDNGSFGGDAAFVFDKSTKEVTLTTTTGSFNFDTTQGNINLKNSGNIVGNISPESVNLEIYGVNDLKLFSGDGAGASILMSAAGDISLSKRLGLGTSSPTAALQVVGSVNITTLVNPASSVDPVGVTGSTIYIYTVVAVSDSGETGSGNTSAETLTGNATLTGSNFNTITWTDTVNTTSYDIYRTQSDGTPGSTGKIGTVLAGVQTFDDTGLPGDGTPVPSQTSGLFTGGQEGGVFTINTPSAVTAGVGGSDMDIVLGDALTTSVGGTLQMFMGDGGSGVSYGGGYLLSAGNGGASGGDGGSIEFDAGNARGGNYNGGDVYFFLGAKHGGGTDGGFYIYPKFGNNYGKLNFDLISADRIYTFPNIAGTVSVATSGSGAPGTTPVSVGLIYCDTTGGKVYISTGTTNSGDWTILN